MVNLFIVLIVLFISVVLFKKASGTLAVEKMNLISYVFYLFLVQSYIGGSLIFLGLRNHYLVQKILNENTINYTYYMIAYTAVVFPLSMYIFSKVLKVNIKDSYENYLSEKVYIEDNNKEFIIISVMNIICIFSTIYMFVKIGYLPFIELISSNDSQMFSAKRIELSNNFAGNTYIKNILALNFTPLMSYITYAYAYKTKNKKWIVSFVLLLICSILLKTYNYAKSPLAFYIMGFVFLSIILNAKIKRENLIKLGIVSIAVIVLMYLRIGYYFNTGLHIYNGPLGRVFYTQIATLFLHVDLFPKYLPFLNGKSLYPTILQLLGSHETYVRSGRVVMEFYNMEGIFNGVAGVMNSLFIGEAYANFGLKGVLVAPIYVGVLLQGIFILFLKMKKSPINIGIFVNLILMLGTISQAGFTDFIYNSVLIANFLLLIILNLIIKILRNKKNSLEKNN